MKGKVAVKLQTGDEAVQFAKNPKNRTIVAIPVLLFVAFFFFFLSVIFSYLGGDAINPEDQIATGVDQYSVAEQFNKIQMAIRIMPSQKTEGNMLMGVLNHGTAEWEHEYDEDFADGITEDYFTTDKLNDYFPDVLFTEKNVPIGNSKPFCLNLSWNTKVNRKVVDHYYGVQNVPICINAQNPKFRWQESDPKDGIDFFLWKQYTKKAAYEEDCDPNSVFVKSSIAQGGTCYRYDVIESVCVAVRFEINEETSSYGWTYDGGCFEDGKISNWMPAIPGTEYSFDKLDFEIRENNMHIAERVGFTWTRMFRYLAGAAVFGAILALILYIYQTIRARNSGNVEGEGVQMRRLEDEE